MFLINEAALLLGYIQKEDITDEKTYEITDENSNLNNEKVNEKVKVGNDDSSLGWLEINENCDADLCASLEQAFSCLFHYPKKNRSKNFEDHLTQPVSI